MQSAVECAREIAGQRRPAPTSVRLAAAVLVAALVSSAAPVAAEVPCLTDKYPLEGQLQEIAARTASGKSLIGYGLQLGGLACAEVTDRDGAPTQLQRVRTIQLIASDRTAARALERLLGAKIRVIGHLDAPDPERHAGHAVLSNAQLVLVLSRLPRARMMAGLGSLFGLGASDDEEAPAEDLEPVVEYAAASADGESAIDRLPAASGPVLDLDRSEIEARLAHFVEHFYLSGEALDPTVIQTIYAPRVTYFGEGDTAVDVIAKDKVAYYERWPARTYTLVPNSLEVRQVGYDGTLYDLSFIYDFRVAAVGRERSGRGYGRLLVDLAEGEGKIVRESGKVISRE
jgi:hypothetical protein